MAWGISVSLLGMDFLSVGQRAIGNGGAFISDAAVAGDGSASNADRRIWNFYDTAGGWWHGDTSETGGSYAFAGMVHIKWGGIQK